MTRNFNSELDADQLCKNLVLNLEPHNKQTDKIVIFLLFMKFCKLSRDARKSFFRVSDHVWHDWPVESQKKDRSLKFWI